MAGIGRKWSDLQGVREILAEMVLEGKMVSNRAI